MKNEWKKFVSDFQDKNLGKLNMPTFDVEGSPASEGTVPWKLFFCLTTKDLRWFQENWRQWQNDMPEEIICDTKDKKIPLNISAIIGSENEKNLWLYECVLKLSGKSKKHLESRCEEELLELSEDDSNSRDGGLKREIFIIHGHDGGVTGLRRELKLLLREAGITPKILEEEPTIGSETIIEKLIRVSSSCAYAVALFTKDDFTSDGEYRARQNVLLETGYFMGKLGRDRISLINVGVDIPSDLKGILYIRAINPEEMNWKRDLLKTLEAANFSIPVEIWREI